MTSAAAIGFDNKPATERVVLDLGCGKRKVPGAVGIDSIALPGVDLVHDLTRFPYPLPSNCADEIHMNHILEHLPNTIAVLTELWRLSKPGGEVHIRVPHYSGMYAWKDPTHVRCFTSESFGYFGENAWSYYTHARFKVRSARLKYFAEPQSRHVYRWWGVVVQAMLDRHPTFGERFLVYLVGGIDELCVTLQAIKQTE
jgi:SAM-dependent methyltransferase